MSKNAEIYDKLNSIIKDLLNLPIESELPRNENLQNYGMDSMKSIELILKLESQFGFIISEDNLVPENFETIDSIKTVLT